MGERTAPALFCILALLFLAAAAVYYFSFAPAGEINVAALPAEPAAVLTGNDDGGGIPTELLPGERIDINTATARQLMRLPGIGEALADAIIAFREERGLFGSTEDILQVGGIGEGKYAAIAKNITVNGE